MNLNIHNFTHSEISFIYLLFVHYLIEDHKFLLPRSKYCHFLLLPFRNFLSPCVCEFMCICKFFLFFSWMTANYMHESVLTFLKHWPVIIFSSWVDIWTSLVAQTVKNPAMQETWVWSLGWEDSLEKEMATYSSMLAWKIPWTEETGRL